MLMYSKAFGVLFSSRYAYFGMRDELTRALGGTAIPGHSIWLVRTGTVDPRYAPLGAGPTPFSLKRRVKTALKRVLSKARPA